MGRARRQRAHPFRKGPSWLVRWREDVRRVDGVIERHQFTRAIGPCTGPEAISKREAARLADETIFIKLDQVSLRPGSLATVEQFVRDRFEPQVVAKRRSDHYRLLLKNHILPEFGPKRLRDVSRDQVQRFLLEKADPPPPKPQDAQAGEKPQEPPRPLSPQTLKHLRNVLHAIFKHAKRLNFFVGEYPTEFIELPTVEKNPRHELSAEQAIGLLAVLADWMRTLVFLLSVTGLRIGEACGLRWKWVNLTDEIIVVDGEPIKPCYMAVRENYVWVRGKPRYAPLKSRKSRRSIPLPPSLVKVLQEHRAASKFVGPSDPVFAGVKSGKPIDHRRQVRRLKLKAKPLGLAWISWHCLRHSMASFGDQAGMSDTERQALLGHADVMMTQHYSHAEEARLRDGLEVIAARLLAEPTKKPPTGEKKVIQFPAQKEA